jgi:acylphosphatase
MPKKLHMNLITGFVKNLKNGSVYIEAEGEEESLKAMVEWCHKGPPWAPGIRSTLKKRLTSPM